jgi:hypothetical protein
MNVIEVRWHQVLDERSVAVVFLTAPSELTTPTGRINRAQSNSVRTLRELHSVTTERDQLRFELEKVGGIDVRLW